MNTALLVLVALLLAVQEKKPADNFVEAKVRVRAHCLAGSKVEDKRAPGGFYKSPNDPKRLTTDIKVVDGRLQLIAEPETEMPFATRKGMRLLLVNAWKEQLSFEASDSRLSIVQEAKDEKGEWKPVEYLPRSWCGNSYHKVFLGAGEYWEFATPRYKGSLKTKLRFAMPDDKGKPLYSNEFDGSVNPLQFSEKEGHSPSDIMDPYND